MIMRQPMSVLILRLKVESFLTKCETKIILMTAFKIFFLTLRHSPLRLRIMTGGSSTKIAIRNLLLCLVYHSLIELLCVSKSQVLNWTIQ